MSELLNPLTFPLLGNRLIEASAGTGKTFTIAALYLRLVLGPQVADSEQLPALQPRQILVVTFTKAATEELRGRIRERLQHAAQAFRAKAAGQPSNADALLQGLLDEYPVAACAGAGRQLQLAADSMDEAAVFTIHSWAQRMLREHAFDSGSLFTQELDSDDQTLALDAARDYWRSFFYPLSSALASAIQGECANPETLLSAVRPLLNPELLVQHQGQPLTHADSASIEPLLAPLLDWQARASSAMHDWQHSWQQHAVEVRAQLYQGVEQGVFNGNKVKDAYLDSRLALLERWTSEGGTLDKTTLDALDKLTPSYLASALKKGKTFAAPLPLAKLDRLLTLLAEQPVFWPELRLHAARWIGQRIERDKQRLAQLDFDDLLLRLDRALRSPAGARLAQAMAEQFPAAMIDEFQDTDPVQLRLFNAIYQQRARTALLLIGDPKQAIYAFRGADIHTYLHAREQALQPHYTLGTNYRSSQAMVDACNALFTQAESQLPDGAFNFANHGLPFHAVQAHGREDVWHVDGHTPAALTCWHLGEQPNKEHYLQQMSEACASEIVRLLSLAEQGRAGFMRAGQLTPLRPSDVAILVRTGREAARVRDSLRVRGVRSVYLSERDSVYASAEAHDVLLCLRAAAEPSHPRALRAALGCGLLGRQWAELDALNHNEDLWEVELSRFADLHRLWRSQGVLSMLYRLLRDFSVPERLLANAQRGGERSLTNVLQLAELLQQAAAGLEGEGALLRHLGEHIELAHSGQSGGDETQVRLESEADLVQVITIHKSKGLEYPLVFLPFIASYRSATGHNGWRYHQDNGQQVLELDSHHPEASQQAEAERLQEDLRLLYVALTRARHACWLGLAALRVGNTKSSSVHKSAIGYLLGHGQALDDASLKAALDTLPAAHTAIAALPEINHSVWHGQQANSALLAPLTLTAWQPPRWWVASYSALVHAIEGEQRIGGELTGDSPDTAQAQTLLDSRELPATSLPHTGPLADFPAGPQPGTFLHGLLEWLGETGFASPASALRDEIAKRCHNRQWQQWIAPLGDWLDQLRQQALPLGASTLCLAQLQAPHYQVEMEFWLGIEHVDTQQLDQLICQHIHPGIARPALARETLNGMLKGFIDLVFMHDGRYYVADYKSNRLPGFATEAMRAVVLEKRYDLQYLLYTLALHRLLKTRLPDYRYAEHMGGAVYLFLRGLDEQGNGLYHVLPPEPLIEALDALFAAEEPQNVA
ncbi:exodeoxyribonuclease V subunit beta [Atopomonas sediminilitoris]|uniref:exodeoxyribonuclease V subunit beta n=1 Tax=Atopomonas sediminilitoris TaxID=2919919 RepID=UPI001F4DD6E3|nr:exodeoxyribonuclease V subunit beta [Atopomonas sediminilitoris]MCJ8169396.1 exodeoxyribonuclease V subunit beta [Atopomonas sediminilitoris]